jgi:hypothetical protein
MRALQYLTALSLLLVVMLFPFGDYVPLDPDEPAAADGSLIAGRARTIFDYDPLLGAFGETRPDPDDPRNFQDYFEMEWEWADRSRDDIARLLAPVDWSFCEPARHQHLVAALQTYYGVRGRQKASFRLRGPRAAAFIEREWSTRIDKRIDAFVRQLIASGFLQAREISPRAYPEFAQVTADVSPIGKTCPSRSAGQIGGTVKR